MTRIGRVTAFWTGQEGVPCFRLVVENGRHVLGCWRYVRTEGRQWLVIQPTGIVATKIVFERVS